MNNGHGAIALLLAMIFIMLIGINWRLHDIAGSLATIASAAS